MFSNDVIHPGIDLVNCGLVVSSDPPIRASEFPPSTVMVGDGGRGGVHWIRYSPLWDRGSRQREFASQAIVPPSPSIPDSFNGRNQPLSDGSDRRRTGDGGGFHGTGREEESNPRKIGNPAIAWPGRKAGSSKDGHYLQY
ncbi:unnamed protein product [Calypogeia fissa]